MGNVGTTIRTRTVGRAFRWRNSRRRGVSEVVATILLLGITVALFAGLFFFVNIFQRPPAQPVSQFSASLAYGGCGHGLTQICSVSIVHLSGPVLTGTSTSQVGVYITSKNHTSSYSSPYTLAAGGLATSNWAFGQTWTLSLSSGFNLYSPDNVTVSIVSYNQLLFQAVLLATNSGQAPYFLASAVTPSVLSGAAASFNVTVQVQNGTIPIKSVSVSANMCQLKASPCSAVSMTWAKKTGLFYATGTTTADPLSGTWYIFVTATDTGGTAVVAIPVTFTH